MIPTWCNQPAQRQSTFEPLTGLGDSLLALWDAEYPTSISVSSGLVSGWGARKGGLFPSQGTTAFRPSYDMTGFNGRPCVTFDGTDDNLAGGANSIIPTGAVPSEVWCLLEATQSVADTTNRPYFSNGGSLTTNSRHYYTYGDASLLRARSGIGTGAVQTLVSAPAVDLTGRHIVRTVTTATDTTLYIDGVLISTVAVVPNSANVRYRIGANSPAAPTAFHQGKINCLLVTSILSAGQATDLTTFLKTRGGIA